ncbi:tRNA pseudouridine(55) synthase TruB [Sporolituus thermophilus]|uniref:tRNA pseudouridine synthase B n=1 Tax=Sporolituus thermophilus DSM 23256 TaxID=1123285 RepID=A0A1G7I0S8_9FIRM|nr:tRNA pseudouridine(55) synthase TruB [Sporolituus thermophilus]SDF06397.1 tRNA pseudouridine synthase B [Sporolituus thermophilus DSM 23256]
MAEGILNILKPPGMTSHDAVAFVRRLYGVKRVGHAGTLDPAAAGVLPVFVGAATRLIEYTADADKSYRVEMTVGRETDTGDDTGNIIRTAPCVLPPNSDLDALLQEFTGEIEQVPPMYSAIKIGGKKLYDLARQGITVERQPRRIKINKIQLITVQESRIYFDVDCSKGTYIRTLCTDIGRRLGCPAVMSFLVRTRVGNFQLTEALTLEEITEKKERALQAPDSAVAYLPPVFLTAAQAKAVVQGQAVRIDCCNQGMMRLYNDQKQFIGIGEKKGPGAPLRPVKIVCTNSGD